jgi:predicted metal-binding protein
MLENIISNAHTLRTYEIGRLGNQIIRNLAVSLIAMKHDLKVEYCNKELIKRLGIELFSGTKAHARVIKLTDDNYFDVYNSSNITFALDPNCNYFQTKNITNFIYNYLKTENTRCNVIDKNPFKARYNENNDLFVHIRLTDVANKNPGVKYYMDAISNVKFDELHISTDDNNHEIVRTLLKLFPTAKLIQMDEITTFQFASTCKHVILSHGSFSAIIGYLSFFSNVYYPEYELNKIWYGDMFSIDGWTKVPKS